MEESTQREIAAELAKHAAGKGLKLVFVGSTAVVALNLYPRTSKDVDALGQATLDLETARTFLQSFAEAMDAQLEERKGRGTLSVVHFRDGIEDWSADLIVPEAGDLIPPAAATLVHRHAMKTSIGQAAIPEHVAVMKAIAWGDCIRAGEDDDARKYAADLENFRTQLHKPNVRRLEELLEAFPETRRREAVGLINRTFATRIRAPEDRDV